MLPSGSGDDRLTGTRQMWLLHPENLNGARNDELEALRKQSLQTSRAWGLKDYFRWFWTYADADSAREFFADWYAWAIRSRLEQVKWLSATGFRLPVDNSSESQVWYWSNHVDRNLFGSVYALTELNWYHWMRSGLGGLPGVEGLDLLNLGSTGVTGNDIVTAALGFKVKPTDLMEVGVAWEVPLTKRRDVIENRLTVDWIVRY